MDENMKKFFQKVLEDDVECITKEMSDDETLHGAKAPDAIFENLWMQINGEQKERLTDDEKELIRLGNVYKKKRKRSKYYILAAVLVLTMAFGLISIGDVGRTWGEKKGMFSGEDEIVIHTEEDQVYPETQMEETEAYKTISDSYGFSPVRFGYLPDGSVFEQMTLDEETQNIQMVYTKEEKVVLAYNICLDYRMNSLGVIVDDKLIDEEEKEFGDLIVHIRRYSVENTDDIRYIIWFEYQDIYYFLWVNDLEETEVNKILENVYY